MAPKGWQSSRSWLQGTGVQLFVAFFAAHPEEQGKFKKFPDTPGAQLHTLPAVRRQALDTMCFLDEMFSGDAGALFSQKVVDHATWGVYANSFGKMLDFLPGFFAGHGGDQGEWNAVCGKLRAALP